MANSTQLVDLIKQQLRIQGINYRKLAQALGLSESAIKQMFAAGNMSLKRLDAICEVLKLDLTDLLEKLQDDVPKLDALTYNQEKELISDPKLLLVAYGLINYWTVQDILERYTFTEAEVVQYLVKLDKMKIIELLPENRVRLLVSSHFQWIVRGPIEQFFRQYAQQEFLQAQFSADGCINIVRNADITLQARMQVVERLKMAERLFDDLHRQDKKIPSTGKQGTTMVLAIRDWEFSAFKALERG